MPGRSGLGLVDGQSMQYAGWQDCMRLARPQQVRHRVRCTWRRTLAVLAVGASREAKGGRFERPSFSQSFRVLSNLSPGVTL